MFRIMHSARQQRYCCFSVCAVFVPADLDQQTRQRIVEILKCIVNGELVGNLSSFDKRGSWSNVEAIRGIELFEDFGDI